jgi:hypothetical protein
VELAIMSLQDEPHFEIEATDLADWLDQQGVDCWWSVDGDPLLMGELSFPCPGDDLAAKLRVISRTLLLFDPQERPDSQGQRVSREELSDLAWVHEQTGDRVFRLGWKQAASDSDWVLAEDKETAKLGHELADHGDSGRAL